MAEEQQEKDVAALSAPSSSGLFWWLRLSASLFALCVAAGIAGAFCVDYLRSRPLDLRDECHRVADEFETLLVDNGVIAARVSRAVPDAFRDDTAHWCLHRFEIMLPPELNVEGIEGLIRRHMLRLGVAVSTLGPTPQGGTTISLSCGDHCCVTAQLRDAGAEQAATPLPAPAEEAVGPTPAALPGVELPVLAHVSPTSVDEALETALPDLYELDLESDTINDADAAHIPMGLPEGTSSKRVAIVVDDGGYGGPVTERMLGLDPSLTLAILPYTPHAEETARRATGLGFEVLLHMPMEKTDFPGCLSSAMKEAEIRDLTLKALAEVPGAVGINNHAGSVFTADRNAMMRFLNVLRGGPLFFVDSRTTADTVAFDVARSIGVPAAQRRVFIDHENTEASIRAQFDRLVRIALQEGSAIAICHFRARTADMLSKLLPELKKRDIALVHVSELLQ